jgi:hypothetical protein
VRNILVALLLLAAPARAAGAMQAADTGAAGVLILGDSNGEGPFGGELYDVLRTLRDPLTNRPLRVEIYAKCGAGSNDWTSREYAKLDCGAWRCGDDRPTSACLHFMTGEIPPLPELYRELGAERRVTLVVLGLNMIIGNREEKMGDARELIREIAAQNSACIWVGPPQTGDGFVSVERYDGFIADLSQTVTAAGCRYISSADKTDRRNLGIHSRDDHYDRDAAIEWADLVLNELLHPAAAGERSLLDYFRQ